MISNSFEVTDGRFHLLDKDIYVIHGWFAENNPEMNNIEVYLDSTKLIFECEKYKGFDVRQRHLVYQKNISEEYFLYIRLPENLESYKRLVIYTVNGSERHQSFEVSTRKIIDLRGEINYCIDSITASDGKFTVKGWVADVDSADFTIVDSSGKELDLDITLYKRRDVIAAYKETSIHKECGFIIDFGNASKSDISLILNAGSKKARYAFNLDKVRKGMYEKKDNQILKGIKYLKRHGLKWTLKKTLNVLQGNRFIGVDYENWLKKHLPDSAALEMQRNTTFDNMPKFSIAVPLYKTPKDFLIELIESVIDQSYSNWELCMCDGSGSDSGLEELLRDYSRKDDRIKYVVSQKQLGISDNTNMALTIATGDFVVLVDHDDLLTEDALYECARAINEDGEVDVIYSDEDKISMDGKTYFAPHFKPDFNIDLLRSMNYITHLFVARKSIMEDVGLFRNEYDGSQDYDIILRCVEVAKKVKHIPRILYHWRSHKDSVAENPESKLYAYESARTAIMDHYRRTGVNASVEYGQSYGLYKTFYALPDQKLVSVIIPTKDRIKDIKRCIGSIEWKSIYDNYEIIIADNGSKDEKTFMFYRELQEKFPKVKVVSYDGKPNRSSLLNFGASHAKGEYLLFMNDDISIITDEFFEEMLGYAMRNDVGAVGAKLYYEDDIVNHAGVILGIDGLVGNAFIGQSRYDLGYFARAIVPANYSAVSGACFMTSRELFESVGGFSQVSPNMLYDIDYCLRLNSFGKLVVFNPFAEAYTYNTKSRDIVHVSERNEAYLEEIKNFKDRWHGIFESGDPYYNSNLTLDKHDFSLKRI